MNSGFQTALLIVVAVGVIAWLMKMFSGEKREEESLGSGAPARSTGGSMDELEDEGEDDEITEAEGLVPLSSEGVAFVPRAHGILLLPLLQAEEDAPGWLEKALDSSSVPFNVLNRIYFSGAGGGVQPHRLGTPLGVGDWTGARIVRGATSADPWRLETLGRDGDFGFHPFATREAAEEALELIIDRKVVKRPVDEDGGPIPVSPEDWEEARRRYQMTESELALETDDDRPPPEGPWVSDRR